MAEGAVKFVGKLRRLHPDEICSIPLGQEIFIGRDVQSCQVLFNEPTVSGRHLMLYSIMYDYPDNSKVKPLVYAQSLSSTNGTWWNNVFVGEKNTVLLSNDDLLRLGKVNLVYRAEDEIINKDHDEQVKAQIKRFGTEYTITTRKLGSGAHADVYMAVNRMGKQVACKIINFRRIPTESLCEWAFPDATKRFGSFSEVMPDEDDIRVLGMTRKVERLLREIEILKNIVHPNVIQLEKVFRGDKSLFIFEELLPGGDLFSYLEYKGGHLDEAGALVVTVQITKALQFLHAEGVIHRDVKPENILVSSLTEPARFVLADFGEAIRMSPTELRQRFFTKTGTPGYVAPEVDPTANFEGYSRAVDMWSLGCVTHVIFKGVLPFGVTQRGFTELGHSQPKHDSKGNIGFNASLHGLFQINRGNYGIDQTIIEHGIGSRAKDFIQRLLVVNEDDRMTAHEAMNHPWFTDSNIKYQLEGIYQRAIKLWRKRDLPLRDMEAFDDHSIDIPAAPPKKRPRTKKPIEPPYMPPPKNFAKMVSLAQNEHARAKEIPPEAANWSLPMDMQMALNAALAKPSVGKKDASAQTEQTEKSRVGDEPARKLRRLEEDTEMGG